MGQSWIYDRTLYSAIWFRCRFDAFPYDTGEGNYLLMYIVGAIGATVLEYITGTVMENLFGVRYWDYTEKKFNFRGRICLEATILWGFLPFAMVEVIQPPVEHMVMMINDKVLYYTTWGITVVFTFDFASSFRTAIDLKEVLVQAEG